MDSRASTSNPKLKPTPLLLDTSDRAMMVTKTLTLSPTSPFATFRPSPLNPQPISSPTDRPNYTQKRSASFPASRPLRPFPSISQSVASAKPSFPSTVVRSHSLGKEAEPVPAVKRPPKTIEISSKWKGGFFVLGMSQAEFSRRD